MFARNTGQVTDISDSTHDNYVNRGNLCEQFQSLANKCRSIPTCFNSIRTSDRQPRGHFSRRKTQREVWQCLPSPRRRSNGELAERVKSILASKNLTLYQVSERSAELFGRSSPQYLPHNLYYDLRQGSFSPSLFQLFAFSRISGYRLVDWLRVFGFDVEAIPRLQIQLSSKRTTLLDSSVEDPHALRTVASESGRQSTLRGRGSCCRRSWTWTAPRTLASLAAIRDKGFLYAKIGYQDAWGFPELLPGSIVRVRPISMDDLLQRPRGEQSKGLIPD